ncbi:hypothetical protein GJAV_G00225640 [Gymnothorax javanicus]|nr:hypothetical protein GJAV_G00225640 [Gymnothorax javanicus]
MNGYLAGNADVAVRMPPLHISRFLLFFLFFGNVWKVLPKSIPDRGPLEVLIRVQVFDNSDLSPLPDAAVEVHGNQSASSTGQAGSDGIATVTISYRPGTWVIIAASKPGYVTNSAPWHASRIPLYATVSLYLLPQRPATLILYEDVVQLLLGSPGSKHQPWVQFQRKSPGLALNTTYTDLSAMLTAAKNQYEIGGFPYPLGQDSANSTGSDAGWVELTAVGAVSAHLVDRNGTEVQVWEPVYISIPLPPDTPLNAATSVPVWRFEAQKGLWVRNGTGYIKKEGTRMTWSFVASQLGYWLAAFPSSSGTTLHSPGLSDISAYHTIFLLAILGSLALLVLVLLCMLLYHCRRRCLKPRQQHHKLQMCSPLDSAKRDQGTSTSHLNLISGGRADAASSANDSDAHKPEEFFQNVPASHRSRGGANARRGESFHLTKTPHSSTSATAADGRSHQESKRLNNGGSANDNQGYTADPGSPPPFAGHYQDARPPEYSASQPTEPLTRPTSLSTQPGQLIFCSSMEQMQESMYRSMVPTLVIPAHYMRLPSELSAVEQALEKQQQQQQDREGIQVSVTLPRQRGSQQQHPGSQQPGLRGTQMEDEGPVKIPVLFDDSTMAQMSEELQALTEQKLLELGVKPHPRAWFVSLDGRSNSLVRHSYIELGGGERGVGHPGEEGMSPVPKRAESRDGRQLPRKDERTTGERKARSVKGSYTKPASANDAKSVGDGESRAAPSSPEDNSLAPLLDEGPGQQGGHRGSTFPRRGRNRGLSDAATTAKRGEARRPAPRWRRTTWTTRTTKARTRRAPGRGGKRGHSWSSTSSKPSSGPPLRLFLELSDFTRQSTCRLETEMLRCGFLCLALLALTSALVCPDGQSCDGGSACCLDDSGEYSCCPRPLPVVLASFWSDESDVICPNLSGCPSEYSCLKFLSTYKCCPLSQGVLCSDGNHCCPEHHRCAEDGHSCVKEKAGLVGAVICPDGESECPDGSTCCQLPDGSWGCCPMVKAVCCEDRVHCCPEGSVCDTRHSKCRSPHGDTPMLSKSPAHRRAVGEDHTAVRVFRDGTEAKDRPAGRETAVVCPDGRQCPDDSTCCLLANGTYGCCPLKDAVCCSDHLHCCPSGTTCDLEHLTCVSATSQTPLVKTTAASKDVDCPDGTKCPEDSTCCELANGTYACCMLENAVCCKDHVHCCPQGTTCDVAAGTCDDALSSIPWLEKLPSRPRRPNKAQNVSCDSQHACPDGSTCCKREGGDWACCPLPEAVCCEDHVHCCPQGTTCDVAAGTSQNVSCDSLHACPDGSTCCKREGGDWACCPLPEAVCCEDHVHCCPQGTTCDVAAGTCDDALSSIPWLEKVPPLPRRPNKVQNVSCDSLHACPDGSTCCKREGGDWACCPLPEAVCCEDHVHCCPQGTTCDVAAGTCDDALSSIPWLEKVPPLPRRPNKVQNVSCDSLHACPDGSTCCKREGGDWACCPLPEAVCCEDLVHCCPHGTTCDVAAGTCDDAVSSIPWLEKLPSLPRRPNKMGDVSCDPSFSCPDGTTCCRLEGGDWACCPLPKAVCCDDQLHCCPKGTTCNVAAGTCDDHTGSMPWLEKVPALSRMVLGAKIGAPEPGKVQCSDTMSCPDDNTCCWIKSKQQWGCCPLPMAVCCKGGDLCCPFGYTCTSRGRCTKRRLTIPWYTKTAALTRPALPGDVQCDPQSSCPSGTTCCPLSKLQWGCCPLNKAVCCEDMKHCCPAGYTCDPQRGSCHRSGSMRWDRGQNLKRKALTRL